MRVFTAVPLADRSFVPTGEGNRVRWYVAEDGCDWPVHGPYADQAAAESAAARMSEGR